MCIVDDHLQLPIIHSCDNILGDSESWIERRTAWYIFIITFNLYFSFSLMCHNIDNTKCEYNIPSYLFIFNVLYKCLSRDVLTVEKWTLIYCICSTVPITPLDHVTYKLQKHSYIWKEIQVVPVKVLMVEVSIYHLGIWQHCLKNLSW